MQCVIRSAAVTLAKNFKVGVLVIVVPVARGVKLKPVLERECQECFTPLFRLLG